MKKAHQHIQTYIQKWVKYKEKFIFIRRRVPYTTCIIFIYFYLWFYCVQNKKNYILIHDHEMFCLKNEDSNYSSKQETTQSKTKIFMWIWNVLNFPPFSRSMLQKTVKLFKNKKSKKFSEFPKKGWGFPTRNFIPKSTPKISH
jgi:hypothetical protein